MTSSLPSFLASMRSAALRQTVQTTSLTPRCTIVMGNSSADLDSFISAVVFSYFYNQRATSRGQDKGHVYVPLLNLPAVPSSELWRLRPEYGTALRLATRGGGNEAKIDLEDEPKDRDKKLLENLVTVADLTNSPSSQFYATFAEDSANATSDGEASTHEKRKQDVILVDHNAPAVAHLTSEDLAARIDVVGCVDHHVDESFVSPDASPRIIKMGIGSCTSLVVQHLRDEAMWPEAKSQREEDSEPALSAMAKLALAPILIDTFNLKATGDKCSDTDRDAVKFLEAQINSSSEPWDRTAFFDAISTSKSNSLNLLTMPEIFARDYKEWTEDSPSSSSSSSYSSSEQKSPLTIGTASLVRPLSWLSAHAGSPTQFATAVSSYAKSNNLALLALLTKGTDAAGTFRKELAVVATNATAAKALGVFEGKAGGELKLEEWKEDGDLDEAMEKEFGGGGEKGEGGWKVWWQGNTEKSRKQVAPLLREAVRGMRGENGRQRTHI